MEAGGGKVSAASLASARSPFMASGAAHQVATLDFLPTTSSVHHRYFSSSILTAASGALAGARSPRLVGLSSSRGKERLRRRVRPCHGEWLNERLVCFGHRTLVSPPCMRSSCHGIHRVFRRLLDGFFILKKEMLPTQEGVLAQVPACMPVGTSIDAWTARSRRSGTRWAADVDDLAGSAASTGKVT